MNGNVILTGCAQRNFDGLMMLMLIKHYPPLPPTVNCRRWNRPTSSRPITSTTSSWPSSCAAVDTSLAANIITAAVEEEEESASPVSHRRRLILLRHAKSSWDDPSLRDHDRPLSKTGQADAAKLSLKLQELGWLPQLILCSDAMRTRETLEIMQQQVAAFSDAQVHFIPSFYSIAAMDGQTADHLHLSICKYSADDVLTVMSVTSLLPPPPPPCLHLYHPGAVLCMGHNRGWEEAASMLTGSSIELKTCNAALLEASGKSWEEAFASAGLGGWKLQGIVPGDSSKHPGPEPSDTRQLVAPPFPTGDERSAKKVCPVEDEVLP
ncbi:hypothetical protein Tsubulata_016426 [Turnera subulata]|uniref:Phosphoglycerate mutase family protein n=1 Tax=Turnera subulata TaxID=218843 RepID=A0A9Q0F3G5_9ROSI|nr:hypothetical protein Tsubulata_016426 [Turnera subulata]